MVLRRAHLVVLVATSCAIGVGILPSHAATSATVVGATIPSATQLAAGSCAPDTAGVTDLGIVLPGTKVISTGDCSLTWGSSNDTSSLRISQTDGAAQAMWGVPDGVLDTSWDTDGTLDDPLFARVFSLHVLTDGSVIAGGQHTNGTDWLLRRYTPTGATTWTRTATACGSSEGVNAMTPGPTGTLYVAVEHTCGGPTIHRILIATGADDVTWGGGDGLGDSTWDARQLDTDSLGRIVGIIEPGCGTFRMLADGAMDTSWDGDGYTFGPPGLDQCQDIAVDSADRVFTAGRRAGAVTVAKFATNGIGVDASWATAGFAAFAGAYSAAVEYMVIDGSDRMLISAGIANSPWLGRMLANGTPDPAFNGGAGRSFGGTAGFVHQFREYPDGSIIVTGKLDNDWFDAVVEANGALRTNYGTGGIRIDPSASMGLGLAIGVDGTTIIGGSDGDTTRVRSYPVPAYDGAASSFIGASAFFGACLRSPGTATAVWTSDGTCQSANGSDWNAVPTTPTTISSRATAGVSTSTMQFAFGTATNQHAGKYLAPVTFEVTAP